MFRTPNIFSEQFKDLKCVLCIGTGSVLNAYNIWGRNSILNDAKRPVHDNSILASLFVSLESLSISGT